MVFFFRWCVQEQEPKAPSRRLERNGVLVVVLLHKQVRYAGWTDLTPVSLPPLPGLANEAKASGEAWKKVHRQTEAAVQPHQVQEGEGEGETEAE